MASDADNEKATFSLDLAGNLADKSAEDIAELEKLRQALHASSGGLREMQAAQRSLRGSTDEIRAAKQQLTAKIDVERNRISALNLSLLKQGVTYEKLATAEKKARAEQVKLDALKDAGIDKTLKGVGGPVSDAVEGFRALKGSIGAAGLATGLLVAGLALTVAALVAVTAALAAGAVEFTRWVFGAADALRSLDLIREAAAGSAENAHNLGTQVDLLASKLATPKEKLNELASELRRKNPYLSGPELVTAFNLVGQAAEAAGDSVGKTFEDIATRGARMQRLRVIPQELLGTGVKFQDVAGDLAKSMKVSLTEAKAALFEGRVPLEAGLASLRTTIEKRFGSINARKLISLDVVGRKIKETLQSLRRDVHLEPLLQQIGGFTKYFTDATVSGRALHLLVTDMGNGLVKAFAAAGPYAKAFLKGLIIGALDVAIGFQRLRIAFKQVFGADVAKDIDLVTLAASLAKTPFILLAKALEGMARSMQIIRGIKNGLTGGSGEVAFVGVPQAAVDEWQKHHDLGRNVAGAFAAGLSDGKPVIQTAAELNADAARLAIADILEIHSPSRVGVRMGAQLSEGVAIGTRSGARDVARASEDVGGRAAAGLAHDGPEIPAAGAGGGAGGGGSVTIGSIVVRVMSKATTPDIAKQVSAPNFVAELTKALEEALKTQGIPTQTTGAP